MSVVNLLRRQKRTEKAALLPDPKVLSLPGPQKQHGWSESGGMIDDIASYSNCQAMIQERHVKGSCSGHRGTGLSKSLRCCCARCTYFMHKKENSALGSCEIRGLASDCWDCAIFLGRSTTNKALENWPCSYCHGSRRAVNQLAINGQPSPISPQDQKGDLDRIPRYDFRRDF